MNKSTSNRSISVHSISEYLFCPRAGVVSHESPRDEPARRLSPNLNFTFPYSLRAVNKQLVRVVIQFTAASIGAALMWWASGRIFGANPLLRPALTGLLLLGALYSALQVVGFILIRNTAINAAPAEPDLAKYPEQRIEWWSLLAAGFDSVRYHDALYDPQLHLSGKPWRVLRRGSLRIPVFRDRRPIKSYAQARAKVAAYCRLLEVAEGAQSPYGVVLYTGEYTGKAIRASMSKRTVEHVARQLLVLTRDRTHVSERNISGCIRCPHGNPRAARWWQKSTFPLKRPGLLRIKRYCSPCGERFSWKPPHRIALALGLHAARASQRGGRVP